MMPPEKVEKHNSKADKDMGNLGKAFRFTHDDLEANRAGYMSRAQQFRLYGITRQLFGWLVHSGLVSRLFRAPPRVQELTGKVRKIHNSRTVVKIAGGSGEGGDTGYFDTAHDYTIQLELPENRSRSFYVTPEQFHNIPSRVEITLYYDLVDEYILSVEPPYKHDD